MALKASCGNTVPGINGNVPINDAEGEDERVDDIPIVDVFLDDACTYTFGNSVKDASTQTTLGGFVACPHCPAYFLKSSQLQKHLHHTGNTWSLSHHGFQTSPPQMHTAPIQQKMNPQQAPLAPLPANFILTPTSHAPTVMNPTIPISFINQSPSPGIKYIVGNVVGKDGGSILVSHGNILMPGSSPVLIPTSAANVNPSDIATTTSSPQMQPLVVTTQEVVRKSRGSRKDVDDEFSSPTTTSSEDDSSDNLSDSSSSFSESKKKRRKKDPSYRPPLRFRRYRGKKTPPEREVVKRKRDSNSFVQDGNDGDISTESGHEEIIEASVVNNDERNNAEIDVKPIVDVVIPADEDKQNNVSEAPPIDMNDFLTIKMEDKPETEESVVIKRTGWESLNLDVNTAAAVEAASLAQRSRLLVYGILQPGPAGLVGDTPHVQSLRRRKWSGQFLEDKYKTEDLLIKTMAAVQNRISSLNRSIEKVSKWVPKVVEVTSISKASISESEWLPQLVEVKTLNTNVVPSLTLDLSKILPE